MKTSLSSVLNFLAIVNAVPGFHAMTSGNYPGARACFWLSLIGFALNDWLKSRQSVADWLKGRR